MDKRYEALCGITQEELDFILWNRWRRWREFNRCDAPEMRERLKLQYDGYHFGMRLTDIIQSFQFAECVFIADDTGLLVS